jgi:glycosyltransferase involved in cell wall biosynthesis
VRPAATRLLRVITRLNVGGPARQAVHLHRSLQDRGFDCRLVTGSEGPSEGRIDPGAERVAVVPQLRREVAPVDDVAAARAIRRMVGGWRPEIVHTHLAKAGALGRFAAARADVPVTVHTFHGHVLDGYFSAPIARAFLAVERRLAARTTALVAVSTAIRDELLDLGIGRPGQWRVVPVGLELGPLLASRLDPAEARRRLGLPDAGPAVGIVGRLVPVKDHPTFLRAAARLARERPDAVFVVAGDGESRRTLETSGRDLLGDRIRFLGWVDDLPALYGALDVVVLTSTNEGTPVSLVEAGAAGRPVVATRVGGVAEVVEDGRTGTLVPPGDPVATAAAVGRLLADPASAGAMGAAARGSVASRFDAARLDAALIELYRDLLGGRMPDAGPKGVRE